MNISSKTVNLILVLSLAFSGCIYLTRVISKFHLAEISLLTVLVFVSLILFVIFAYYFSYKRNKTIPVGIYFAFLFCLYTLRMPDDIISTYLWAEDGSYLIQDAIFLGLGSLTKIVNGTYWVVPRVVGLLCYWFCNLLGNLALLPALQGIICKLIAAGCIALFLSDRFEWIIKERVFRFIICACVILAIPYYATDIVSCDTSLPFIMNFAVFLIGLDCLCKKDAKAITFTDSALLSIIALSNAAAPFPAGVAFFSFCKWLWYKHREKTLSIKGLILELCKTLTVIICALIQVLAIAGSSRSSVDLHIFERICFGFTHFVFQPYFYSYLNWIVFLFAIAGWLALVFLAKMPIAPVIYIAAYNYAFLLYCSLVADYDKIEFALFREQSGGARYILLSYMIAAFLLSWEICCLLKKDIIRKVVAFSMFAIIVFVSMLTYSISTLGYEFSASYRDNINVFDSQGEQVLSIPIGPWTPWDIKIPWNSKAYKAQTSDDIAIDVSVNYDDLFYGNRNGELFLMIPIEIQVTTPANNVLEHIFIDTGNEYFLAPKSINMQDSNGETNALFIVDSSYLEGNELRFVGITDNDLMYVWTIEV